MEVNNSYAAGKKLLCGGYSEYTPTGKSYFVKAGRYGKEPKIGAIVYFYHTSQERVAHVGIVISVDKDNEKYTIKTVEGNTSSKTFERNGGAVAIKSYTFTVAEVGGLRRINGFGYPTFDETTCEASDLVRVALGEVGYLEKASNYLLHTKTMNVGTNNYTKYGQWYGDNGAYWCQQFVSWCTYMACVEYQNSHGTGWTQKDGKWYYKQKGELIKGVWCFIGGRWYVFDGSGVMIKGWFKNAEGDWYYMNPADGALINGQWFKDNDKWYYATDSGILAKNVYIKDEKGYCWVNYDGEWDGRYVSSPDLTGCEQETPMNKIKNNEEINS